MATLSNEQIEKRKLQSVELSEDELEQAAGGVNGIKEGHGVIPPKGPEGDQSIIRTTLLDN